MSTTILDHRGRPYEAESPRRAARSARAVGGDRNGRIKGRFDNQFSTAENERHWQFSDSMSVDASASWMVRRILRMRNRYEFHNNSYCAGIASTIANYVIGTGPRLQLLTQNKKLNSYLEGLWNRWAREIRLAETLWLMRLARTYNGESVALMRNNPRLYNPIKLDVFQVEADQLASPLFGMYPASYPDQYFDGVVLDPYGRPMEYHILRQHPGATGAFVTLNYLFDQWPAKYVIHDYRRIRPGQQRGIPEMNPAMPLFAQLRRYTLAVLGAAEVVADNALTIETSAPADTDGEAPPPFDTFDLRSRMVTVLPDGYKLSQPEAAQPTTTYDAFVNTILREICRCLDLPAFFGSLDARQANMSSAYVVTQPFARMVQVDRSSYDLLLDKILDEFLNEAIRVPGLLPKVLPDEFPHSWGWPSIGVHADPSKVAAAQGMELANGTTTIPREYAKHGLDWETAQEEEAKALGMTVKQYRAALAQKRFALTGTPTPAIAVSSDAGDDDDDDEPIPQDQNMVDDEES
jgi:capsid protein